MLVFQEIQNAGGVPTSEGPTTRPDDEESDVEGDFCVYDQVIGAVEDQKYTNELLSSSIGVGESEGVKISRSEGAWWVTTTDANNPFSKSKRLLSGMVVGRKNATAWIVPGADEEDEENSASPAAPADTTNAGGLLPSEGGAPPPTSISKLAAAPDDDSALAEKRQLLLARHHFASSNLNKGLRKRLIGGFLASRKTVPDDVDGPVDRAAKRRKMYGSRTGLDEEKLEAEREARAKWMRDAKDEAVDRSKEEWEGMSFEEKQLRVNEDETGVGLDGKVRKARGEEELRNRGLGYVG